MSRERTKAELIVYATQHADMKVRESAAECLYQLGAKEAARSLSAIIAGTPTTAGNSVELSKGEKL